MFWIMIAFVVFIIVVCSIWLALSIKIIGPDEMAVKVIFGGQLEFRESGWVFDLRFPFGERFECFLKRYPQKMYNFNYKAREVITAAGAYQGVQYGALKLKVDAVAYLNFPREIVEKFDVEKDADGKAIKATHPLIKILRAHIPVKDKELEDWTEEAVVGALRIAFGQMTWKQSIEDMKSINEEVEKVFRDIDGALIKAGFREPGIKLVVAEIILPKEIEAALSGPDKARLSADAAKDVAKQESIETAGTLIGMMGEVTGLSLDDIQKAIQKSPAKFIKKYGQLIAKNEDLLHRLMALNKNALRDIRVQGTKGELERMLLNLAAVVIGLLERGGGKGRQREEEEEERKPKSFKELVGETKQQREGIKREKKKKE